MNDLLTVTATAQALGRSAGSVRHLADQGRLPTVRASSGARLFHREDVERFLATQESKRPMRDESNDILADLLHEAAPVVQEAITRAVADTAAAVSAADPDQDPARRTAALQRAAEKAIASRSFIALVETVPEARVRVFAMASEGRPAELPGPVDCPQALGEAVARFLERGLRDHRPDLAADVASGHRALCVEIRPVDGSAVAWVRPIDAAAPLTMAFSLFEPLPQA